MDRNYNYNIKLLLKGLIISLKKEVKRDSYIGELYIGKGKPLKKLASYRLLITLERKRAREPFN